jgi:hypothetical protein
MARLFSTRHYKAIAKVLHETVQYCREESVDTGGVYESASKLSDLFAKDSPDLFDRDRFMLAVREGE